MIKIIFLCLSICQLSSQESYWVKLKSGTAFYRNAEFSEWQPIGEKDQISIYSYILTKPNTILEVFKDVETITLTESHYIYLDDLFKTNKMDVLSSLTSIDASQLTSGKKTKKRRISVTGSQIKDEEDLEIPFFDERKHTVTFLAEEGHIGSALLSLKRFMIRYPKTFKSETLNKQLKVLYELNDLSHLYKNDQIKFSQKN